MKITLVRVRGSKDPAMVLLGHPRKKMPDDGFFWLVDECCNPNACEYWETEIVPFGCGFYWGGKNQFFDSDNASITAVAREVFVDLFDTDHSDWVQIDYDFNELRDSDYEKTFAD